MMATWKKLATKNNNDQIEGNITGKAHGGLASILGLGDGGTNTDMTGYATNALIMTNGTNLVPLEAGGEEGDILVSTGSGSWTFMNPEETHDHGTTYVGVNGGSIAGNLSVAGAIQAEAMNVLELSTITQADGGSVVLNASGGNADGDGCGLFASVNAGSSLDADEPAILWEASAKGGTGAWQVGKYGNMYDAGLWYSEAANVSAGGSAPLDGMFGADSSGNIYVSV